MFLLHTELFDPGATMRVVLDLPFSVCVWISAVVAIIYTVLGGLYSVAYTDVIQISLVLLSLVSLTQGTLKMTHFDVFFIVFSSPRSGCASHLFWPMAFIVTSLKQQSVTHTRPLGWATWSLMMSGYGLIIF